MKTKFPYAEILAEQDPEFIAGFAKGLAVIEVFGEQDQRLTISQVAERVGLERATVRRCLLTLTRLGYADYDGKFFSLTPRMLRLGYAYLSSTPFISIVSPFLEELSQKIGQTCAVAKLDGAEIVYLARAIESARVMTVNRSVGGRLPAYGASLGRVILASWPEDEAPRAAGVHRPSEGHAEEPDRHRRSDGGTRPGPRPGYSINDEETAIGLRSIAIPLMDGAGKVTAGLNVGVVTSQASVERMIAEYLPPMLDIQRRLHRLIS